MIFIFGFKGRVKTVGQGTFNCPHCRARRQYEHRKAQRWFTLYFIPVFPTGTLGESITCTGCNQSYTMEVLEYVPAKLEAEQNERIASLWHAAMINVACAFGPANEAQAEAVQQGLARNFRQTFETAEILDDCRTAPATGVPLDEIIGRASSLLQHLDHADRENFLLSALRVVNAGAGEPQQHHEMLTKLGHAFGLSEAHMRGILAS